MLYMRLQSVLISNFLLSISILLLASSVMLTSAQTRTSPSYQLQSDSINVGGGLSNSASFGLESTAGEVATGSSDSASFALRAGYQQMQEVFLSLSGGADITLSPNLPGLTGGESNGSTTFTVVTDSPAGYQLTLQAAGNPALQTVDNDVIADYSPAGVADFAFTIPPAAAVFGFSSEGEDVTASFLNDGATCGIGSTNTALACWVGFTNSAMVIASGSGSNHPIGTATSVHYRVGVASGAAVLEGVYTATTTVTALPL